MPDEKKTVRHDEGIQAVGDRLVITRSVSVLKRKNHWSNRVHFVNSDYDDPGYDHLLDRTLILTNKDWVELGEPSEITISVEAGDQLNVVGEPRAIQEDEIK